MIAKSNNLDRCLVVNNIHANLMSNDNDNLSLS